MLRSDVSRPVGAAGVDVQRRLETLVLVAQRLGVGEPAADVEVARRAHALPIVHRAAGPCSAPCRCRSAAPCRRRRGRRRSSRQRPCARSAGTRIAAAASRSKFIDRIMLASMRCCSSACGIATLLRSTQSGCGSDAALPKNRSSERLGAMPSRSWPLHAGLPWRVYTIERARSYVNAAAWPAVAANAAQRDGGIRVGGDRVRVECRQHGRAARRVEVGRSVVLDRLPDDAGAGARCRC